MEKVGDRLRLGGTENAILTCLVVFDVSNYLEDHPGGAELLIEAAGTDATEAFDNAGHSEDAFEIMAALRVGALKGYRKPAPKRSVPVPRVVEPVQKPQPPSNSPRSTAAAVAITASIAVALSSAAYYSPSTLKLPKALLNAHSLTSNLPRLGIPGGFPAGFLAASALTSLLAAAAARQLAKLTQINSGFARFPPHKPSSKPRRTRPPAPSTFLNPQTYQSLPLTRKDTLAPGVFRLVFSLPTPDTILGLPTGQHVSIRATINKKTVSRSYTPVSNDSDRGVLDLIVRCYPQGLLSGNYLAHLRPGIDSVEFRGPKGAMRYHRGWARRIGMIAGGTGITPMYQIIRAVCEDDEDQTEISLVYANRSEGDILLRNELEDLAERFPNKLRLWYLLDVATEDWGYGVGYVTKEVLMERMPTPGNGSKTMLCGPPGMVNAAKSMLVEMGFKAPGVAAKMEDDIFVF
jgi:cytochrome-b5 reductase